MQQLDPRTKARIRVTIGLMLGVVQALYIVFPFDLIPDFIPIIGWIDDLMSLAGLSATAIWVLRLVHEVGVDYLLGTDLQVAASEPYDPIPHDVLRSM